MEKSKKVKAYLTLDDRMEIQQFREDIPRNID